MSVRRFVSLAPLLALGLTATAVPAFAEGTTLRDARGDMYSMSNSAPPNSKPVPAPGHANGDAVQLRVTHGKHALRFRLKTDRLQRRKGAVVFASFTVKTDTGKRATLDVFTFGKKRQGDHYLSLESEGAFGADCPGARTKFRYTTDVIIARVPRRCLGNPAWVKAGAGSGVFTKKTSFFDDVNTSSAPGDDLVLGPKLRHRR